jgi:hypothetical protein
MPGHSSLLCADCVNLSAMPGIHVFLSQEFKRKTWMAGTSSAKTRFALLPGHDVSITHVALYQRLLCQIRIRPSAASVAPYPAHWI